MMKRTSKCLLIVSILIPLALSGVDAQNIRMERWVFGSGGMVSATNSQGTTMSGMVGQLAIGKISNSESQYATDVYQGFWIPEGNSGVAVDPIPGPMENQLTNYPNPFSNSTTIKYSLEGAAYVTLIVYDVNGNRIRTLANELQYAGEQNVVWDAKDEAGTDVSAGSYLYELVVRPAQMAGPGFDAFNLRNVMVVVR